MKFERVDCDLLFCKFLNNIIEHINNAITSLYLQHITKIRKNEAYLDWFNTTSVMDICNYAYVVSI